MAQLQLCTQDRVSEKTIWSRSIKSEYFAHLSYRQGLLIQDQWCQRIRNQELQVVFLGFNHPPTITLGKRSNYLQDLLLSPDTVETQSIEIVPVDRGGQATLHAPGQLVLYPVVNLRFFRLGVFEYVTLLQEAVARVLSRFGVSTKWDTNRPGLYTSSGKIAFFGIRVSHGISTHGISINVCNDLDLFARIRSCGISGESFDRLNRYVNIREREVFTLVATEIGQTLRLRNELAFDV